MNEYEMQAAVDQLVKDMLDKGLRKPEARVWIEANKEPSVGISSGVYGEGDRMTEYPSAPTVSEALDAARAIIAAMPDAETTRLNNFMGALGKVIDLGRDLGVDVDFINPLTATMKRLSENVITDQRGKGGVV